MENKANYALVGVFATLVIGALLAFVYWFSNEQGAVQRTTYNVVFDGAVTGLAAGTDVLFNGLRVGTVSHVGIDPEDPGRVIARIDIAADAPVMTDTRALLEIQGLTGQAHVQLLGGSPQAGRLQAQAGEAVPTLVGEPSDLQAIMEGARDIVASADSTFQRLDRFLGENEGRLSATLANVESLSEALASFAGEAGEDSDVASIMTGIRDTVDSANATVTRLESFVTENEPRLATTLANVEEFSGALAENADGVERFLASISATSDQIGPLAAEMRSLTAETRNLLAAIPSEQVTQAIRDTVTFTDALARNSENIDTFFADASSMAKNLSGVSEGLSSTLAMIDEASEAIDPQVLARAMDNVDRFSVALGDNAGKVDEIINNTQELTQSLSAAANRIDAIVVRVDAMVDTEGGDTLFTEIADAARAVRVLAEQLDARTAEITTGLTGFTTRGLGEYTTLASEARNTLERLNRVLANVERNPQVFIFGGQTVRDFQR
ncbi:MlaD family protein [Devosia nitrariae]|uniref:Organic solvent ABC transporter substrate-binding protein n=1 Tax=Devosia nitrariae TaxID=2071872 RepID=A0ABQ5WF38_9HYPH|nr:MlaD family protein [Devosia nitrariae]GLQ58120.1 organic solvent ABC transporter substrate-binding protein [Devosia nitrariae]